MRGTVVTAAQRLIGATLLLAGAIAVEGQAQSIPVTAGGNASSLVGVDFELPILVDMSARTEKLGAFALTVRWNRAVLEFRGGQNGNFGALEVNEDSLASGVLIAAGVNPAGVGGLVTVGVVRLRPLVAATDTIAIAVRELYAAGSFADLTSSAVVTNRVYCTARGRFGDIDHDQAANSRDALIALSAAVGLDVSPFDATLGDVDADGSTGARDALIILSYGVGLDVSQFRVFFIAPGSCATTTGTPGIVIEPGSLTVVVGQEIQYEASVTDASGNRVTLADPFWKTSDPAKASITPGGRVLAIDSGTVVISAIRRSTADSAGVTLAIVPRRTTHWVDAFAFEAENRLGTVGYPFATIPEAVAFAAAGDTIRVRAARYEPFNLIDKPVVIVGEVLAGAAPGVALAAGSLVMPEIIPLGDDSATGFILSTDGVVEVHNFRLAGLAHGVWIEHVGSFLAENLRVVLSERSDAGIAGDSTTSAGGVTVRNSRFTGQGVESYGYAAAIRLLGPVGTLAVENSSFVEHGSDVIELYRTRRAVLRNNVFRHNDGYALFACGNCTYDDVAVHTALELTRNRIDAGYYGGVYADPYWSASFDRNVIRVEYDAVELYQDVEYGYGESASRGAVAPLRAAAGDSGVVTFLGDSIAVRTGGWLDLSGYDSLGIDSLYVDAGDGYAYVEGGRIATVKNSRFVNIEDWGFYIGPWPRDSTRLIVRNSDFLGPDSSRCDRCGVGIGASDVWLDADSVRMVNLYNGIELYDGAADVRRVDFVHNRYDIDADCAPLTADSITSFDAGYSIEADGCSPDPVVVTNSRFEYNDGSIMTYRNPTTITNNVFIDSRYAVEVYDGSLVLTDNQFTRPMYAVEYDGYGATATVDRNTIVCRLEDYAWAIEMYDAEMRIRDNVIADCYGAIEMFNSVSSSYGVSSPVPVEIRGNTITLPPTGYVGIEADGNGTLARVVGNSITGPARYGSIYVGGASGVPKAVVDSNTVANSKEQGIWGRYVDTLHILDNVITDHGASTSTCCQPAAAILVSSMSSSADTVRVRRNRIARSKSSGIVLYTDADPLPILVDSNAIKGADSVGVWVRDFDHAYIRWNAIDSTGMDAVRVSSLAADTSVKVTFNNFTRSGRSAAGGYGINNTTGLTINGANNWWNDAKGPSGFYGDSTGASAGDSVSANVVWSPWLTAPAAAPTPAAPALVAGGPHGGAAVRGTPPARRLTPREPPARPYAAVRARPEREPPAAPTGASLGRPVRPPRAAPGGTASLDGVGQRLAERALLERQRAERRDARLGERAERRAALQAEQQERDARRTRPAGGTQ